MIPTPIPSLIEASSPPSSFASDPISHSAPEGIDLISFTNSNDQPTTSSTSQHQPVVVTSSSSSLNKFSNTDTINRETVIYAPNQPIIDEQECLEALNDWEFAVELIQECLEETERTVETLTVAVNTNNHQLFHDAAQSLYGASLVLHLPALSSVSRSAKNVGRYLDAHCKRLDPTQYLSKSCETNAPSQSLSESEYNYLLRSRLMLIDGIRQEYDRLAGYLPTLRAKLPS